MWNMIRMKKQKKRTWAVTHTIIVRRRRCKVDYFFNLISVYDGLHRRSRCSVVYVMSVASTPCVILHSLLYHYCFTMKGQQIHQIPINPISRDWNSSFGYRLNANEYQSHNLFSRDCHSIKSHLLQLKNNEEEDRVWFSPRSCEKTAAVTKNDCNQQKQQLTPHNAHKFLPDLNPMFIELMSRRNL